MTNENSEKSNELTLFSGWNNLNLTVSTNFLSEDEKKAFEIVSRTLSRDAIAAIDLTIRLNNGAEIKAKVHEWESDDNLAVYDEGEGGIH
ncbi:hypothetical protein [Peribacillus loiseleuriae]|uniref:hypothetical protein n=1 Tax=Peribacillus loiseleuriae TaxID=1679170 RepID=UPI003D01BDB1